MSEAANPTQADARPSKGWYVAEAPDGERSCVFVWWFYEQTYVSEAGLEGAVPFKGYKGRLVAKLDLASHPVPAVG